MLINKLLRVPFARGDSQLKPPLNTSASQGEVSSSALTIVHAGGTLECYYMAIPAVKILDKYPSYVLAKPEVFRRPWDSVVRPEKILVPGQKFFLVPVQTVKKLRRGIKKPSKENISVNSFVSQGSNDIKKHVRFAGIDVKYKVSEKKNKKKIKDEAINKSNSESGGGKSRPLPLPPPPRRLRIASEAWQPSLQSISENQGD